MRLLDNLRARARSHGHGVHSPLAYALVTDCLCLNRRYGYYDEEGMTLAERTELRLRVALPRDEVVVTADAREAAAALMRGATVLTDSPAGREAGEAVGHGITLADVRGLTVIVGRRSLPKMHYTIRFR